MIREHPSCGSLEPAITVPPWLQFWRNYEAYGQVARRGRFRTGRFARHRVRRRGDRGGRQRRDGHRDRDQARGVDPGCPHRRFGDRRRRPGGEGSPGHLRPHGGGAVRGCLQLEQHVQRRHPAHPGRRHHGQQPGPRSRGGHVHRRHLPVAGRSRLQRHDGPRSGRDPARTPRHAVRQEHGGGRTQHHHPPAGVRQHVSRSAPDSATWNRGNSV